MARRLPPAQVRITAKDETRRGIASATRSISGLQHKMAGLGKTLGVAAAGLGFQRLISSQLKALDAIGKSAKQFDIATESVSSLQFAAEQSGLSFDTFSTAMRTSAKNVGEAAQGIGMAKEEIQELGLSAAELRKLPIDDQFRKIVNSLSEVQNQGDKTRIAMAIFGRSGSEILKVQDSLSELEAEAVALGITFDQETVRAAEDANDAFNRMKGVSFATAVNFTSNFLPAIEATANYMIETMPKVGRITGSAFTLIYSTALLAQAGFQMVERAMLETAEEPIRRWEAIPAIVKRALLSVVPIPGLGRVLAEAKFDQGLEDPLDKINELDTSIDELFQTLAELRGDLIADPVSATVPRLEAISDELSGSGGINDGLKRVTVTARKLPVVMTTWQKAAADVGDGMQRNLEQFFFDPAEEGIQGFAKSMINTLRQIAAQIAAQKIYQAIFGDALGAPPSFGMSFGADGSFAGTPRLSLSGPSPSVVIDQKFARGGRPTPGRWALVGEKGPEIVKFDRPSTVIPNNKIKGISGNGGATVNQVNHFNIAAGSDPAFMQKLPAILEENRRRTIAELSQQKSRSRF